MSCSVGKLHFLNSTNLSGQLIFSKFWRTIELPTLCDYNLRSLDLHRETTRMLDDTNLSSEMLALVVTINLLPLGILS